MSQIEPERLKKSWGLYLISGMGLLFTILLVVAAVYFWEETQQVKGYIKGYGYAGGFLLSILGGITIIPIPSLLVTFTLGRLLDPVYVGLVSGLGEALGGITVYLTGAGAETIWSRLWSRQQNFASQPGQQHNIIKPFQSRFWSKGQTFYNRLVKWAGGWGSSLLVFVVSMMIISPYYFAGLAAGTLRMGLLRFFLVSWAGKTIKGLVIAFAGYWGLHFLLRWFGA